MDNIYSNNEIQKHLENSNFEETMDSIDMKIDKITAKNAKIDYIQAKYGYSKKLKSKYSINKINDIIIKNLGVS